MSTFLIFIVAFFAAMSNALAGGGTFMSFPALTGLGKLTEKAANMTSTVGLWPGQASSVYAARRDLKRVPRDMAILFGIISLIGGIIGALLLQLTSPKAFGLIIPWLLLFATLIFAFSKPIARWAGRGHGGRSRGWTIFVAFVQFAIAIYGGYFGAGMSILMLAGLSFAGLDDMHQLNGMKVLLATITNGVAALIFVISPGPWVQWRLALPMAVFAAVGGFLGIAISRRVPQTALRLIVLFIAITLTAVYFAKAYG